MSLALKKCVACEGGVPPLPKNAVAEYLAQIDPAWKAFENKKIERVFLFTTFREGITFVDKVASLAEKEQHHPDIHIAYNRITIELSTHAIQGLSENDFILAAKIDRIHKT